LSRPARAMETVEKAVALRYTSDLPAPIVLAKGQGALADRIRDLAREHGIQVVPMPEVTDALIELPVGSLIPERFYQVIAELLVFVRRLS
jgi:type III secretion system FlhB-like substrate exporter